MRLAPGYDWISQFQLGGVMLLVSVVSKEQGPGIGSNPQKTHAENDTCFSLYGVIIKL